MNVWTVTLGEDHVEVSLARERLADISFLMGRLEAAFKLYCEAIDNLRLKVGNNSEDVARILDKCGDAFQAKGENVVAECCYFESMKIYKEIVKASKALGLTFDESELWKYQYQIGLLYVKQGKYTNANDYFHDILSMNMNNSYAQAQIYSSIGNLAILERQYKVAIRSFHSCLTIGEKIFLPGSVERIGTLINLGKTYVTIKSFEEALRCFNLALGEMESNSFYLRNVQKKRIFVSQIYENMGDINFAAKKNEKAMNQYTEAFRAQMDVFGSGDRAEVLKIRHKVALVLARQCKYDEALFILKDILRRKKDAVTKNNIDVAKVLLDMSEIMMKTEGLAARDAIEIYCTSVMRICGEINLPTNHPYLRQARRLFSKCSEDM